MVVLKNVQREELEAILASLASAALYLHWCVSTWRNEEDADALSELQKNLTLAAINSVKSCVYVCQQYGIFTKKQIDLWDRSVEKLQTLSDAKALLKLLNDVYIRKSSFDTLETFEPPSSKDEPSQVVNGSNGEGSEDA